MILNKNRAELAWARIEEAWILQIRYHTRKFSSGDQGGLVSQPRSEAGNIELNLVASRLGVFQTRSVPTSHTINKQIYWKM